ncbi:MAG: hypothetical protein KJ749_10080 [Planctomycetes bacterium]|nr:hypothetical protein [Planctomycetota bacterium]
MSAAWTATALTLDFATGTGGPWWSLYALIGFVVFVALIYWRIYDQWRRMNQIETEYASHLERLGGDQQFELAIRRLQERARSVADAVSADSDPWQWRGLVEEWTMDAEKVLEERNPNLIPSFRGGPPGRPMPPDPLWEIKLLVQGPSQYERGKLPADVKRYVERRNKRLGEIMFSMPNPRAKGMMLG